jgi:hypothetical protein
MLVPLAFPSVPNLSAYQFTGLYESSSPSKSTISNSVVLTWPSGCVKRPRVVLLVNVCVLVTRAPDRAVPVVLRAVFCFSRSRVLFVSREVEGSSSSELAGEDAINVCAGVDEGLRAGPGQGGSPGSSCPVDGSESVCIAIL